MIYITSIKNKKTTQAKNYALHIINRLNRSLAINNKVLPIHTHDYTVIALTAPPIHYTPQPNECLRFKTIYLLNFYTTAPSAWCLRKPQLFPLSRTYNRKKKSLDFVIFTLNRTAHCRISRIVNYKRSRRVIRLKLKFRFR